MCGLRLGGIPIPFTNRKVNGAKGRARTAQPCIANSAVLPASFVFVSLAFCIQRSWCVRRKMLVLRVHPCMHSRRPVRRLPASVVTYACLLNRSIVLLKINFVVQKPNRSTTRLHFLPPAGNGLISQS